MATPATVAAPAGAPARPGQQPEQGGGLFGSPLVKSLVQAFAIYSIINAGSKYFQSKTTPSAVPSAFNGTSVAGANHTQAVATGAAQQGPALVSIWPDGSILDVFVKLSTAQDGQVDFKDTSLPSVSWEGVEYAKSGWSQTWDTEFDVPESVQHNASLWVDIFVTPTGHSPDPSSSTYTDETLHVRKMITRYYPYKKPRVVKNLLAGAKMTPEEEEAEAILVEAEKKEVKPIISYYHPNVSIELVCNSGALAYAMLPPPLQQHVHRARGNDTNAAGQGFFYPITYANDFWLLKEQMFPLNETTTRLPLKVTFNPTAHWKWQIMASLDDSMTKSAQASGGSGSELDEVKRMLTETNPVLLGTTILVSILHMLFEMLAFTSDISHWRSKKELVGVSVRTIITNVFVQLIIMLYLMDNNENTSWMILFGQGTGLLIEAWKITKAVDIKIVSSPASLIGYKVEVTDKHVLSDDEKLTQEYDQLAFRYVAWGTTPLLVGYTIYSLYYNEHRSWYSFTISTLTSFVYAFGFVQLIPQLIINYKLKSVAHLPMKTLTYKFFATIVDDFFSFVIKMPLLHRLACFRDDVVFLVLLYQMWCYKVDYKRANEYGQQLTEEEAAKLAADQAQKLKDAEAEKVEPKKDR